MAKGALHLRQGFESLSVPDGEGRFIKVCRFTCVGCGTTYDQRQSQDGLNPEAIANQMKNRGWDAHARRPQDTFCPACKGKSKPPNDPDSELKKMPDVIRGVLVSVTPAKPLDPPPPPATAPQPDPTAVTPEQRAQVRHLLERYFDEAKGCYAPGWTDQRIAAEAGLYRISVTHLREAAYGPIRITPEMQMALTEMKRLEGLLAESERAFRAIFDQLTTLETSMAAQRTALAELAGQVNAP